MKEVGQSKVQRRLWVFGLSAVFFVFCFLYLWLVVDCGLIFYAFGELVDFPEFSLGRSFFAETVTVPGGAVEYASSFLSQLFFYSPAASLIVTGVAAGFWLCAYLLVRRVGGVSSFLFGFPPALGVVLLYCYYNHQLTSLLALLVSAVFGVAYVNLRFERTVFRVAVFGVMSVCVYYAAAGAGLIFAVVAVVYELSRRSWAAFVLNVLVWAAVAYVVGVRLFWLEGRHAYLRLVTVFPLGANLQMASVLYIYLYLAVAPGAVALWSNLFAGRVVKAEGRKSRKKKRVQSTRASVLRSEWLRFAVSAVVLGGVSLLGTRICFDSSRNEMLVMNSLRRQERWVEYLAAAKEFEKHGYHNVQVNYDVNHVLYHTDRLGDEMFSYMQSADGLLLLAEGKMRSSMRYQRAIEFFYDLGDMNSAEHWVYEVFETEGASPDVLKSLADINIVKGQFETARIFLRRLSKDLLWGGYARKRLDLLAGDGDLSVDDEVRRLRSLARSTDKAYAHQKSEGVLLEMLEANPKNKMALEYLMAFYLLTHKQDKLVANLYRLEDAGYERIPEHWQEGILIYCSKERKGVDLHGFEVSAETQERFGKYVSAYTALKKDKRAAFAKLAPEFGNSYFFYSMFDVSGAGG